MNWRNILSWVYKQDKISVWCLWHECFSLWLPSILRFCNRPDILDHASRIVITHPNEETDLYCLLYVINNSMDGLLASRTLASANDSPPDVGLEKICYLEIVESFGSFGAKSWITVHVSHVASWLLILLITTNSYIVRQLILQKLTHDS